MLSLSDSSVTQAVSKTFNTTDGAESSLSNTETRQTHQVERHGVLAESLHIRQASFDLGLDVALLPSWKPDPSDPLVKSREVGERDGVEKKEQNLIK